MFFGPKELEIVEGTAPAKDREEILPRAETLSFLSTHLDRNYKKLRRKIRRGLSAGKAFQDPRWLSRLEEINDKLKDLEKDL